MAKMEMWVCAMALGLLGCPREPDVLLATPEIAVPKVSPPPAFQADSNGTFGDHPPQERAHSLSSLVGFRWQASNAAGTWQLTYVFHSDGTYTASGQPAWEEVGKVTVVHAEAARLLLRLSHRIFDGQSDEDVSRELVFAPDGASFTLAADRYVRHENVASVAVGSDSAESPAK